MGLHTNLPIHAAASKLLDAVTETTLHMRRDAKHVGNAMIAECLDITTMIQRANTERDKTPHLIAVLEKKCRVEALLKVGLDKHFISTGLYAIAVRHAVSVGQQAIGWRRNSQERQLQGSQGDPARA